MIHPTGDQISHGTGMDLIQQTMALRMETPRVTQPVLRICLSKVLIGDLRCPCNAKQHDCECAFHRPPPAAALFGALPLPAEKCQQVSQFRFVQGLIVIGRHQRLLLILDIADFAPRQKVQLSIHVQHLKREVVLVLQNTAQLLTVRQNQAYGLITLRDMRLRFGE